MSGLKKFQIKTVEHVMSLFNGGQNRVLVADETGLGKTIIAKGVIEKMAKKNQEEKNRKPLSVIYVCSNDALAKQNVKKLLPKDANTNNYKVITDRLSYLFSKDIKEGKIVTYYKITPGTTNTKAWGRQDERALMYSIVEKHLNDRRIKLGGRKCTDYDKKIIQLIFSSKKGGEETQGFSEKKGLDRKEIKDALGEQSLKDALNELKKEWTSLNEARKEEGINLRLAFDEIYKGEQVSEYKKLRDKQKNERKKIIGHFKDDNIKNIVKELKCLFIRKAIEKISPDLVIFDEFQNFSDNLLKNRQRTNNQQTEVQDTSNAVMNPSTGSVDNAQTEIQDAMDVLLSRGNKQNKCKFLFLSATPFKFYATDAEGEKGEKAYQDFKDVITFLYDNKNEKNVIDNFSKFQSARNTFLNSNGDEKAKNEYIDAKNDMEDFLYGVMCRTEKPIKKDDQTDEEKKGLNLPPSQYDINATLTLLRRSDETSQNKKVINLSESCPYIKSFSTINSRDDDEKDVYTSLNGIEPGGDCDGFLWLDHNTVIRGRKLDLSHAKYAFLHNTVFQNNAEKLLWIPPLKKDLPLDGPFKNARGYSKLLVFSKWSVVPDMTSVLLSYEQSKGLRVGKKILKKERDKLKSLLKDYLKKSDEIASAVVEYLTNPDAVRIINACSKANTFANRAIKYCKDGCLRETIEEYLKLESKENLINALEMEGSYREIRTLNKGTNRLNTTRLPIHFSMPFSDKDDDVQNAFNSPFWPFVLTMTDKGAEGFDFHYYCDSIMHWNLPANPVVLEQREGRVDRYRSYAVRKAEALHKQVENDDECGGLYPDWMHKDKKINVYVPCYENSEECAKYEKLTEDRKKYRAAFGQDKQERFVRFLEKHPDLDVEELSINLSPCFREIDSQKDSETVKKTSKKIKLKR